MSFSYDASTDAGRVRLLITDTDGDAYLFEDAEISAFLDLNDDQVKLAAAQALDIIATNEALLQKRIRLLDLSTDGPAVAKALREHARQLRTEAIDEEVTGQFDWAELVIDEFGARERLGAQRLRNS